MEYRNIYNSQIFEQSQCIWHENAFVDNLRSLLAQLGYQPIDDRKYVWERSNQRVYLAIVDDLEHLNLEAHDDFFGSLSNDCIVITDNWFNRPLSASVITLPQSWFGIYAHRPHVEQWRPSLAWSMPINRIDYNRMMLFLEMHFHGFIDDRCLVNFNCARHTDNDQTADQKDLWNTNWNNLPEFYQDRYQHSFETLTPLVPFSNHSFSLDKMLEVGMVNIVVETYVSDHSVALSEKIFRALVMPRAWRVMGGTWTVSRLKALGFDVLEDVIDHDTDGLRMIEDKISRFVLSCNSTWSTRYWSEMAQPCMRSSKHNQDLLESFRQQWPRDFARWLPGVIDQLI